MSLKDIQNIKFGNNINKFKSIKSINDTNKKNKYNYGISLVVLMVSISVMLIISTAVIINFSSDENIFVTSKKTAFMSDVKTFETELEVSKLDNISNENGLVEDKMIYASEDVLKYGNETKDSSNIYTLIPSLKNNSKYER